MAWKTLCNEVEFLTRYPEVALAITDSAAPVPGYLYGEINAITYIDHGTNCKPLVHYLISRLEASVPLVAVKVLKLLLYLVMNGHADIIEEVKFHEVELKAAMSFYGLPDDFHGKTFYENIRKMSKELLEYVFSENKMKNESSPPPVYTELTGYGSSASTQKMSGFGFTVKNQKSLSEALSDGITNFVDKFIPPSEKEDSIESHTVHLSEALPQYKPLIINKNDPEREETVAKPKVSPVHIPLPVSRAKHNVSVYKPGRPGGGWDDSDEETEDVQENIIEEISEKSGASGDSLDFSKIELKEVSVDSTEEWIVVNEFTVNEELKKLEFSNIASICKRCSSLNCDKVLTFLVEKLSEKADNVQLRALILMEYLLFHDIITLESLTKLVLPSLSELKEKGDCSAAVKIKAKKLFLVVEKLNKKFQQKQPKQFVDTTVKCS